MTICIIIYKNLELYNNNLINIPIEYFEKEFKINKICI